MLATPSGMLAVVVQRHDARLANHKARRVVVAVVKDAVLEQAASNAHRPALHARFRQQAHPADVRARAALRAGSRLPPLPRAG